MARDERTAGQGSQGQHTERKPSHVLGICWTIPQIPLISLFGVAGYPEVVGNNGSSWLVLTIVTQSADQSAMQRHVTMTKNG